MDGMSRKEAARRAEGRTEEVERKQAGRRAEGRTEGGCLTLAILEANTNLLQTRLFERV